MSNTNYTRTTNDTRLALPQNQTNLQDQVRHDHYLRVVCSFAFTVVLAASAGIGVGLAEDLADDGRLTFQQPTWAEVK